MKTVEILKHHLKNRIDFGYFPFSDWSNMINDALEVAISALEQPVYHYLPEVPEDGEEVIGYSDTYGIEVLKFFKKDNAFMDAQLYETTGVYAWTRIPPKPPVKEGGGDVT